MMQVRNAVALGLLCLIAPSSAQGQAEFVVHNANIYTASVDQPRVQAMAIRGERVLMTGTDDEVLGAYDDAERVNLEGRTVIPGMIDAHAHLLGRGLALLRVDLMDTRSMDDVIERLKDFEQRLPKEAWLIGRGWDQNDWPEQDFPSRQDLDREFPDRPVLLERVDGHAVWVNTAALRIAGLNDIRSAGDPAGGIIVRDDASEPTGIFIDTAARLVEAHVPDPTPAERREALRRVLDETARLGLTGVHDAGIGLEDVDLYKASIDSGTFNIRLYGMVGGLGPTFDRLCQDGLIYGYGERLTVRSVKLYMDGALGSRGAALLEPYADDPDNRGLLRHEVDAFVDQVVEALTCGFQVATHAIGDHANRVVLGAYDDAMKQTGRTIGRHRIEHAQIMRPEDIPRFHDLGIIASVQPTHATSDMYWAEDRLGRGRLDGAYAWRSFLDSGVRVAFGSDFPVEDVDPIQGFHAAVTRQDADGWPEDGWLPHQRVTRLEALRGFTIDAAFAAFQEDDIGSLEPGKKADFVVLSKDIMTIPPDEILEARVLATYLGGERIYDTGEEWNASH